MATFLFDKIIFGPVKSRRLGVSLGINLLPTDRKVCNYDCIYCECGWNDKANRSKAQLPARIEIKNALEKKLKEMVSKKQLPDVITFAGNGEPTMHPDFGDIIDDTLMLRNELCPEAGIAVLSNATLIHKTKVAKALRKVDQNILKLDTVNEKTFLLLNKPAKGVSLKRILENLEAFQGKLVIQTLFLKAKFGGEKIDNTSDDELDGLIAAYKRIKPEKIMIYTFQRDTAASKGLDKITASRLSEIKEKLEDEGLLVEVSA
jgi:wyosine [tRNA(Phe)-imidazoG37] synthetase (radical SAM superfamily)